MEFNAQITKLVKKYFGNTYAQIEISLNTCRNTSDFMCDLELFPKIWSYIYIYIYMQISKAIFKVYHLVRNFFLL